jgi:predicted nucleic-acid-binding protein
MIAADTNLVVRLLTQDDKKQAAIANTIYATQEVWIAKTVLLETSWVLESVYGFSSTAVRAAILLLVGLPNVRLENDEAVVAALDLIAKGLEFADALHLTSRPDRVTFVTFDKRLVERARRAGVGGVESR